MYIIYENVYYSFKILKAIIIIRFLEHDIDDERFYALCVKDICDYLKNESRLIEFISVFACEIVNGPGIKAIEQTSTITDDENQENLAPNGMNENETLVLDEIITENDKPATQDDESSTKNQSHNSDSQSTG